MNEQPTQPYNKGTTPSAKFQRTNVSCDTCYVHDGQPHFALVMTGKVLMSRFVTCSICEGI